MTNKSSTRPPRRNDGSQKAQNLLNRLENKIDKFDRALSTAKSSNKLSAKIGRKVGGMVGQSGLGALAASQGAKLFGHGDYIVKHNSVMNPGQTLPKFSGETGTRVIHKEFIKDIKSGTTLQDGSTTFDLEAFKINPRNKDLFPWLHRMAPLYDQWIPNGIVLEFRSTSSEFNGVGQSLGAVIMSTDYDPYDPLPISKQEMENSEYAISSRPCDNVRHGLECAPNTRPTQILYTSSTNGAPLTSIDLGTFSIATKGMAAAGVTIGELWISYDVTFLKKQLVLSELDELPFYRSRGLNQVQSPEVPGTYLAGTIAITGTSPAMVIASLVGVNDVVSFADFLVGQSVLLTYTSVTTTVNTSVNVSDWVFTGCTKTSTFECLGTAVGPIGFTFLFTATIDALGANITMFTDGSTIASELWNFTISTCDPALKVQGALV